MAAQNVPQKLKAQAHVFVRPLDQPRNVRHRHPLVAFVFNHPHHGVQGGKAIGRHLRLGRAQFAQKRAFSRIGKAHQPGVRDLPQLKIKHPFLALHPRRELRRRPVGRCFEVHISFPALAPFAEHELLPHLGQVRHQLQLHPLVQALLQRPLPARRLRRRVLVAPRLKDVGVLHCFIVDQKIPTLRRHKIQRPRVRRVGRLRRPRRVAVNQRARRHRDHQVRGRFPITLPPGPIPPVRRVHLGIEEKRLQIARVRVHPHHDVRPFPPVAPIGPSVRIELPAVKVGRAVPAIAGPGVDFDIVDKHEKKGSKSPPAQANRAAENQ